MNNLRREAARLVAVLLCSAVPLSILAESLPQPTGPVILSVTGAIGHTNAPGAANFDRAMLESLGSTRMETGTPWTSGDSVFEGVLGSKLLEAVGAKGDVMLARALNDYTEEIPLSDFFEYPVLLALKADGQYMGVRDKGPIWVVYPTNQYPELDTHDVRGRWIWQLRELEIR